MKKLDLNEPEGQSLDLVAENIARLRQLFPEAWTEGAIDFEVLKQLLGGVIDERDEKYGLNWHGKRRARQIALTPSTGTLRPCPEESVDWDTTQNLMIEGDNLEVLKLLQKSYAGKVKLIYIDPPYNTGNDFIYPDDFSDGIRNYLTLTGQLTEEGRPLSSNAETSGRFHTAWLNMIYPRLKAARTLLRDDGVLFVSIDDAEFVNLRQVCNEVFGGENFLATFVRRRRMATGMRDNPVSPDHEYVVAYAKNLAKVRLYGVARKAEDFPFTDERGRYRSTDLTVGMTREMRPNQFYAIVNPRTGREFSPPVERVWRFEPSTMQRHILENNILWPDDNESGRMTRPRFKTRFDGSGDEAKTNPVSTWIDGRANAAESDDGLTTISAGLNQEGTKEVRDLFGEQVLEYPKPVSLIRSLCALASADNDIVMDFFAGSGTTGHAVWSINQQDGMRRRFILVQLPEATGRADYSTIASVTSERLRRAGQALRSASPLVPGDLGFRVFRLSSSNMRPWVSAPADLEQLIIDSVNHLEPGRTDEDILYELLLKLGLELGVAIERVAIGGRLLQSVGDGALLVCLARAIEPEDVESLAMGIVSWRAARAFDGDVTCVFRDSAFSDDVVKTNLAAILEQHGFANVRSL
jgi:adenine-specific DNA-methyltransferase